jgi:hypothetical protein
MQKAILPRCALTGAVIVSLSAACTDSPTAHAREPVPRGSVETTLAAQAPAALATSDGPAASTVTLPVNESITSSGTAFRITQAGSGRTAEFFNTKTSGIFGDALVAQHSGPGAALRAIGGSGSAGIFTTTTGGTTVSVTNTHNSGIALNVVAGTSSSSVNGQAIKVTSRATSGPGVDINQIGGNIALRATTSGLASAAEFKSTGATNGSPTLFVTRDGAGHSVFGQHTGTSGAAGNFQAVNSSHTGDVLFAATSGSGFAAHFATWTSQGKGLLVETFAGSVGLQVVGGSKNAVVGTSSGARALYTEESSEVWFTDYGQGRLTGGKARIAMDRTFAETVSLGEPYHVFVQTYGDADLMVVRRSASGFDVVRRGSGEDAEFSYRIVAKRRGFERQRLERAPWADASTRRQNF